MAAWLAVVFLGRIAIPPLKWLMPGVAQPMRYETNDVMKRVRKMGALPPIDEEVERSAAAALAGDDDFASVCAALIYLGGSGAADEAHNIVTPLSWPHATVFGGEPKPDGPAATEAAYVHALIHRLEANHVGEFGTGYHNSAFWFASFGDHPIFPQIREVALRAAEESPANDCKLVQRFAVEALMDRCARGRHTHVGNDSDAALSPLFCRWAPVAFNGLLAQAFSTSDDALRGYCEHVATAEVELLLDWCLGKCGLASDAETGTARKGVSENVEGALAAVKRVSDAHIDAFQKEGLVVVRAPLDDTPGYHEVVTKCAAIAARLLGVDRVWLSPCHREECMPGVDLLRLDDDGQILIGGRLITLSPGDVVALSDHLAHQEAPHVRALHFVTDPPEDARESRPTWTDPLYGSRGVSPTSVVQWSKGPPAPKGEHF